jgi:hypothetical protein
MEKAFGLTFQELSTKEGRHWKNISWKAGSKVRVKNRGDFYTSRLLFQTKSCRFFFGVTL